MARAFDLSGYYAEVSLKWTMSVEDCDGTGSRLRYWEDYDAADFKFVADTDYHETRGMLPARCNDNSNVKISFRPFKAKPKAKSPNKVSTSTDRDQGRALRQTPGVTTHVCAADYKL